jgi:hypothetical protein
MLPSPSYAVELLCRKTPALSRTKLHDALHNHCGAVVPEPGVQADDVFVFSHSDFAAELGDPTLVAQTMVVLKPASENGPLDGVVSTVLVADLMSTSLAPLARLRLFERALQAALDVIPCAAVRWLASKRVVSPHDWLRARRAAHPWDQLTAGPVAVRTFPEVDGESWMDSLGLYALGLPDVQLRYRGIDEHEARMLLGEAVLENLSGARPVDLVDAFAEPHRRVVQVEAPRAALG